MRILHVSAQKPEGTGSGVYLTETMRGFARLGAEQVVVAGIMPGDAPVMPEGVRLCPVVFDTDELPFPVCGMSDNMPYRATRYRDLTPQMVGQFRAAFDRVIDEVLGWFAPDLVICHHLYLLTAHLAMRDWPCPIVGISHNTDLRQYATIPLEREAIHAGVNRLDTLFALHAAQAQTIVETFGVDPGKVHVIGTGFNDQEFRRLPGVEKRRHSLIYVGKIWRQKGVPNLLRALDLLPESFDDVHLDLVGGYSDKDDYDAIVEQSRSCRRSLDFRGKVSQDDLVAGYNASEVFVLPSLSEGLPLVVIEALACGCKVVVPDLPGIREWVASSIDDAPVWYVTPPAMVEDGGADPADAPRFEQELARTLQQALESPAPFRDVSHLSWKGVCMRILTALGMDGASVSGNC